MKDEKKKSDQPTSPRKKKADRAKDDQISPRNTKNDKEKSEQTISPRKKIDDNTKDEKEKSDQPTSPRKKKSC